MNLTLWLPMKTIVPLAELYPIYIFEVIDFKDTNLLMKIYQKEKTV